MKMKALAALTASFAVIGCATGGLQGQGASRSIAPAAQQAAAQQHPAVVQEFGGALTGSRASYVTGVGNRVAQQSGIRSTYTFTALNSPVMNAFAVPGGYVYITRQLMGLANDEAELASVLGHEVGHVAADHSRGRQNSSIFNQGAAILAALVTGSSQIGQVVGQIGQLRTLSYSRNQEFEADDLGVRYMAGAGYDPAASASFLGSLGAATSLEERASGRNDERATPNWARTHPLSADRVTRSTQRAQQTGMSGRGLRNRDQYLAMVDGLIVGDDPAQGVVEGRNFTHPDLRFRFTVPQGYGIQNGTTAVSVMGSNGQAQFSTGRFNGNLTTYIAQVLAAQAGQQVQAPQPRTTTVNGIPAAYSTVRASTQSGQVDVTVFAYRWDADTAYHFTLITPAGQGIGPFSSMVGSLSRLSTSEAAAIRPRVIDVVTVGARDTVQSLAARMAYSDLKTERFLTLNGLGSNARLTPGQKVKLVVYGARS